MIIDHAEASGHLGGRHDGSRTSPRVPLVLSPPPRQPDLVERIERVLVMLAYFIELDGDVHLPMYEKFEAELEALKRVQATRDRARERLSRFAKPGRPEGDAFEKLQLQLK